MLSVPNEWPSHKTFTGQSDEMINTALNKYIKCIPPPSAPPKEVYAGNIIVTLIAKFAIESKFPTHLKLCGTISRKSCSVAM